MFTLIHGNSKHALRDLPENSVDAIVTDAPYELGFMGKRWDATGIAFDPEFWAECLRVLKPGGYLLAFGGTRTYHRMTCAIEDAGFEIRDCLSWLYGTGFPKSLNVSKAIDEHLGATRPVVGYDASRARPNRQYESGAIGNIGGSGTLSDRSDNGATLTAAATDEAAAWEGWGTALKPAVENFIMAIKPFDLNEESAFAVRHLESVERELWLWLSANTVETNSSSSHHESNEETLDSAQWRVGQSFNTQADLSDLTGMSPSVSTMSMCLNIVRSWKRIFSDDSDLMNTFITVTGSNTTTVWQILKSSLSKITPDTIIEAAMNPSGSPSDVVHAIETLSVFEQSMNAIRTLSARVDVMSPDRENFPVEVEQVVMARKPLIGTVAENVLTYGTGGINIDGCRIGFASEADKDSAFPGGKVTSHGKGHLAGPGSAQDAERTEFVATRNAHGRWPANVILSHTDACVLIGHKNVPANGSVSGWEPSTPATNVYGKYKNRKPFKAYGNGDRTETVECWECTDDCPVRILDEQTGDLGKSQGKGRYSSGGTIYGGGKGIVGEAGKIADEAIGYGDRGGASRFFYVTKPSRKERDAGCESLIGKTAGEATGGRVEGSAGLANPRAGAGRTAKEGVKNFHPTVKPIALMRYLVRLVTPPGGTVLDPFLGSGSTGCAAVLEDVNFIGIELTAEYLPIAEARIRYWEAHRDDVDDGPVIAMPSATTDTNEIGLFS